MCQGTPDMPTLADEECKLSVIVTVPLTRTDLRAQKVPIRLILVSASLLISYESSLMSHKNYLIVVIIMIGISFMRSKTVCDWMTE